MTILSTHIRTVLRFLIIWVIDGFSILITALILPGITIVSADNGFMLIEAFAAAFLLSIVNLMIRPIVLLLARPLGFIAVFVIGFFVNALALMTTSWLLPVFQISSWSVAFWGGFVFATINVILTGILEVNEEGSFYQGLIERLAREQSLTDIEPGKRGLVMMEIDGLSYHHMKQALADGYMPTLQRLIDESKYDLTKIDCGIPSQTSACQAGILFGDNENIPAFRWYDKQKKKLYVSGNDAQELNDWYANGNGLLRGGTSINNMLNGDAKKSLLTLAGLFNADRDEKKQRAEDMYLLCLNPYFLTRTFVFFIADIIREVWQGWQQKRQNVHPRLNRLAHGYPIIRAVTTVLMRDISANLTMLDIIRGAPSIYVTWPGYDEVAHHSGPWTKDAFKVLATYDKIIARVQRTIREKAPRPYDLIILSDHGQSFGATFKQRYGLSLKEFIKQQLPQGTRVAQSVGGDTGVNSLTAVSGELENIQTSGVGISGGRALARRGQKFLDNQVEKQEGFVGNLDGYQPAEVTAYGSGNLAQVYFDLFPRKIKLSELNQAYPGMVDALVQHEGIGIVCGYEDDGTPVVLSKSGRRNLHNGEVIGKDPLLLYSPTDPATSGHSDIETRAWQVRRVMDFPNAGDLMVISTVYDDGTVAALEELVGNHGGLGGEQTDSFLFHPREMNVYPTRNSIEVFNILKDHHENPPERERQPDIEPDAHQYNVWSLANLWDGLKDVSSWYPLTLSVLVFDRAAYQEIVTNKRLTGPALLLGLASVIITSIYRIEPEFRILFLFIRALAWLISVLIIFAVGRLLTRQGNYTRTLRGLGFSNIVLLVELVAFLPPLEPLSLFLGAILGFLSSWIAAATAHNTRGWRTIIFPILAVIVTILVPIIFLAMVSSILFSFESVIQQFGF